ncbi:hypothetical protein N7463_003674 [Penicillium fimorum]|uniref:Uncharacterized protein n=1 Tax=Penicillium fimorum TaxID=1882269 RepID=A0A9W9Y1H7_9EURO|nr:hypothetical protein N7463_003674 [Penicillium fimorum]
MFATQSPQTPFRKPHYTPTHSSPLGRYTMSPTHNPSASQSATPNLFSNPPPIFNIQTEPIIRHTQNNHSPIAMNFNASSASTTPTSNAFSTAFSSNPFFTTQPTSPSSPTRQKPKYEARYASIANPLKDTASLARSKTRKMFLNRVRHERDDGRFEARGEQMMRMEHLADRRRWEENDAGALDEFLSQEEAMEMALRETQSGVPGRVEYLRSNGPGVSFSDDEYDDIFMGLSESRENQSQSQSQDMDMS